LGFSGKPTAVVNGLEARCTCSSDTTIHSPESETCQSKPPELLELFQTFL
jgi:hypothetical protein